MHARNAGRFELERVGMLDESLESEVALVRVELVVHLPIAVLVAGAGGGHVRLERRRVQLRDRVVLEDVLDLVGLDVFAIDLRIDLARRIGRSRGTRSPAYSTIVTLAFGLPLDGRPAIVSGLTAPDGTAPPRSRPAPGRGPIACCSIARSAAMSPRSPATSC